MPEDIDLWVHIDPQGRVLEVHAIDETELHVDQIRNAMLDVRYIPFIRNDAPVEAWVQDTISLAASEDKPTRTIPFPQVSNPSKISIQLSRTGCFGTCPSYFVTIRGDGEVTYRGNSYVSISGIHTSRITPSEVTALLERFRAANFLGLKESYRAGVTDNPTYQLSVNLDGKIKVVEDYVGSWVGMPAAVTDLENAVDIATDSARWVGSSHGTPAAMQEAGIAINSSHATEILGTAVDECDVDTVRSLLAAGTRLTLPEPSTVVAKAYFERHQSASLLERAVESNKAANRLEMEKTLLIVAAVRADKVGMQHSLARAAESGYADLARILIGAGADPAARLSGEYAEQQQSETYLMLAAASGVWAMLNDALARPHDVHAVDARGLTALVFMVYNAPMHEDIFPIVDRLLDAGADRADLDRVLLETCQPNWIPGIVARGGNVNARDAKGNTPLFQPCTVEGVQALLDAGADPSQRNLEGKTAIEDTFPPEHGKEDPRAVVIRRFLEDHLSFRPH